MTPDQAGELLTLLIANYPRTEISDATNDLWMAELGKLDYAIGEKAVQSVMADVKVWPSIAHLNEHVGIVREQAARVRREAERREAERAYAELPKVPLREIPAVAGMLERLKITPPSLERVDDGACDDCHGFGARCRVGKLNVCDDCARMRLRAAEKVAADTNSEAA